MMCAAVLERKTTGCAAPQVTATDNVSINLPRELPWGFASARHTWIITVRLRVGFALTRVVEAICDHSGLNLNIQIQKLVFRFNSIQIPIIQYSGFIQDVIPWQVLAEVNVSEVTGISTICSP
jgi:hypothetical protein